MEFVNAAFRINELVFAGEERVGIGGNTAGHHEVFNAVDDFRFSGTNGGTGNETATGGDVKEDDRIILGVNIFLHGGDIAFPTQKEHQYIFLLHHVKRTMRKKCQ